MNSIKPLATIVVLAVVGIGLYLKINQTDPIPPEGAPDISGLDAPFVDVDDLSADASSGLGYPTSTTPGGTVVLGTADSAAPAWVPPPATPLDGAATMPSGPGNSPATGGAAALRTNLFSRAIRANTDVSPPAKANELGPLPVGLGQMPSAPTHIHSTEPPTSEHPVIIGGVPDSVGAHIPPATASHVVGPPAGVPPPIPDLAAQGSPVIPAASQGILPADGPLPFTLAKSAIDDVLARGELSSALRLLTEYYDDPSLSETEQRGLTSLLNQLAGTVIYSTGHFLQTAHFVQPGDTLSTISGTYQVSPELLAKINRLPDPANLSLGSELKVVPGPFEAIVDLNRQEVRLILSGHYAGRFRIANSVAAGLTAGAWEVRQKAPPLTPNGQASTAPAVFDGKVVLGPIGAPAAATSLVIQSIDLATSAASYPVGATQIQLSNHDAKDIYDILTVGSRVTVRR